MELIVVIALVALSVFFIGIKLFSGKKNDKCDKCGKP